MAAGIGGGGGDAGGGLASLGAISSIGSLADMSMDVGAASDAGAASANAAIDTSFDATPVDTSMDMSSPSMMDMSVGAMSMDSEPSDEISLDDALSGPTDAVGGASMVKEDQPDLTDMLSMQLDTQMYQADSGDSGSGGDVSAQVAATYAAWGGGDAGA